MRASIQTPWVTADVRAEPGEVVAVIGPNGAGKSTLLRALAGLQPATGSILLGDRDVIGLPAADRGIGWMPQERLLFERKTALANAAYGLRARGVGRRAARRTAQEWLDRLGVGHLSARRPAQLSGGQAARVALARALAPAPQLLLLDEPLAALDAGTRDDIRRVLRSTLTRGPAATIVVTHDVVDVIALADRVLVLEGGRLMQDATPAAVTAAPATAWVARLLGKNAWRGTTDATGLLVDGGGHVTAAEPRSAGRAALALAEPSAVTLHRKRPEGSARTVIEGAVAELRPLGGRVRVLVHGQPDVTAEVTAAAAAELHLADGGPVFASLKATEVTIVDV
ncbi:MAG: ATP-binding cassette domain-containing protein [Frankiaceae bacterium]|nr:ATP-binding cassette domain-containing protein [Frankiaceae bacterium]